MSIGRVCWILIVVLLGTSATHAQTCGQFIGGYIPSYRNPAAVDYSKLSHVFYAFVGTNNAGELLVENASTTFPTFVASSVGKQRFLSLAGANGASQYAAMTTSPAAITAFANNCVSFCQTHQLQGIDMDWEGITTAQDSVKFGNLARALAAALHSHNLSLVITIGYGSFGGNHYNVGVLKKADWIQLMVYDQAGTWAASPYGNHATFQHVLDAVAYWKNRGFTDQSKIVIGLPFYGYRFNTTSGGLATALTYAKIATDHPLMACNQDETNQTFFNGPQTIREKVDYVQQNNLKGVMIWEMGQDLSSNHTKSLLRAISLSACDQPPACDLIVAVSPELVGDEIEIISNPVTAQLVIGLHHQSSDVSGIHVVDLTGRTIVKKESTFNEIETIAFSDYAPGLYLAVITLRDQRRIIKRFVKTQGS